MENVRQLPPQAPDGWADAPPDDDLTRTPPQDIAAEQSLLGSMMISADAIEAAVGVVGPADFYRPAHETIYRTILALKDRDEPVDAVIVVSELTKRGVINRLGGAPYIHTLISTVPATANAVHYARIVREQAVLRGFIQAGMRISQMGYAAQGSIADFVDAARGEWETAAAQTVLGPSAVVHPWAPLDLTKVVDGEELNAPAQFLKRDDDVAILYPGKIHSVSGESESGKTWLLLLAAAQIIGAGGVVLYLDFEDSPEGIVGRLRALGLSPELILQGLRYCRPDVGIDESARAILTPLLTNEDVSLCIVDGVTEAMNLHGWNPLDNTDAAKFYNAIPRFVAKHGPAVAMIDHVVKDQEKRGRYAMGAQHKLAGIDGAAYLVEPIRPFGVDQHGISRVRVAKDRPGRVREHAVGAVIGDLQLISKAGEVYAELRAPRPYDGPPAPTVPFRPTAVMEKVSRLVEYTPNLSKAAIETAIGGKREVARLALEMLEAEGFVKAERGPRNAIVHRSVRPFREAPDAE